VATIRVVIYHASGAVIWSWFAAMPVMFFVAGSLYAGSLDRRPTREVLRHRFRRLLIPLWAFTAVVFAVYTAAGAWGTVPRWGIIGFLIPVLPAVGPHRVVEPTLYWTWMALWYINAYAVFLVVGIPLRRLQRRWPKATLAVLVLPVILSAVLREPNLGALTCNLVFWTLGYVYHDNQDRLPRRSLLLAGAAVSAFLGVAYAGAVTGLAVLTTAIPFLNLTIGLAWLGLALGTKELIAATLRIRPVDIAVRWLQQRALTVYLWHAAAIGLVVMICDHLHLTLRYGILSVAVLAVTYVISTAMGWLEDLAADRRPRLVPVLRPALASGPAPEPTVDLRDPADTDSGQQPAPKATTVIDLSRIPQSETLHVR
jgi:peptidoglycan/LPS O-acetylase OafA/YrhL